MKRALEVCKRAIKANPGEPIYLSMAADVSSDLGEFPEAIGYIRTAIELKPESAELRNSLAGFQENRKLKEVRRLDQLPVPEGV